MRLAKRGDIQWHTYEEGDFLVCRFDWLTDGETPGVAQMRHPVTLGGQLWSAEYAHYVSGASGTYRPKLLDESGEDLLADFTELATLAVNTRGQLMLFQEAGLGVRPFVLPPVWLQVTMSTAGPHSGMLKIRTRKADGL